MGEERTTETYEVAQPMAEHIGGKAGICLRIEARDKDGNLTGIYENPDDLATAQWAQITQTNMLATTETITDTTNTGRSISANTAATAPTIYAGTGSSAAAVTDYVLQTPVSGSSGNVSATVNAYSGSGTSGAFTITGTITNSSGSTITYSEVGIEVTISTHLFLITHDVFTGLAVSNSGTLAITYTITLS